MSDESTIRETIDKWLKASKDGDLVTLSSILDDDVLFVVSGQPPFGKKEFFGNNSWKPSHFESKARIHEVVVNGDWAMTRVDLEIEMAVTDEAKLMRLAGPTLSVWRKTAGGRWVIWRDANMVMPRS